MEICCFSPLHCTQTNCSREASKSRVCCWEDLAVCSRIASPISISNSIIAGLIKWPCRVMILIAIKSRKSIFSFFSLRMLSKARWATGKVATAMVPPIIKGGMGNPNGPPSKARVVLKAGSVNPDQKLGSGSGSSGRDAAFKSKKMLGWLAAWIKSIKCDRICGAPIKSAS